MSGRAQPLLSAGQRATLADIVGGGNALTDEDVRAGYETDWTGRWSGRCSMIVRPANTAEVSAVLTLCARDGIEVIPQGGNTGLVGGSVPRADTSRPSIVLSTRRLTDIGTVDTDALQVTTGAGVTIAAWRAAARAAGLDAPIDFAARESATVGGAIATNAGGSRVIRFGTMRQQVMGIKAVLADGSVVGSLGGLPKETVGVHWPSFLAGSEGTLAVITTARLRLVPRYDRVVTALVTTDSIEAAVAVLGMLRHRLTTLDAVEVMLPDAMSLVAHHLRRTPPVTGACTLLVECADHDDPTDELVNVLGDADGLLETAIATDYHARETLLAFRDRITESIAAEATRLGTPTFKLDVAVPVGAVTELIEIAEAAATDNDCRLIAFGHLAEGNLHLNYLGCSDGSPIAAAVLPSVAALGGTISAEHGVGIAKTPWLPLIRSAEDLAAQAAVKHALDTSNILNPGVLTPPADAPNSR